MLPILVLSYDTTRSLALGTTLRLPSQGQRSHAARLANMDVEKFIGGDYAQLTNTNVRSFGWRGVTVTVKDRQTKESKNILNEINGMVKCGEMLALMGPS